MGGETPPTTGETEEDGIFDPADDPGASGETPTGSGENLVPGPPPVTDPEGWADPDKSDPAPAPEAAVPL
jgi:hypothetical protein